MNRIKALREYAGYSVKDLAGKLRVPQKELSAWERGATTPGLAALRDMAVLFGCAIEDLFGVNPFAAEMGGRSSGEYLDGGHWGHIGIRLNGEKTSRWFSITQREALHVSDAMSNAEELGWMGVFTLNNKFIAINMNAVQRIRLLDDAADPPAGDWDLENWDANGASTEIYRGILRWARKDAGIDDPELHEGLESEAFQRTIAEIAMRTGKDSEQILEEYDSTRITLLDGEAMRLVPHASDLLRLVHDFVHGEAPEVICFDDMDDGLSEFIPSRNVATLEIPLHDVIRESNTSFDTDAFEEAISIIAEAARKRWPRAEEGGEEGS